MQKKKTSSPLWQESLKHYFPQDIRTRGNAYVRKGRVRLKNATYKLITGQVLGSRAYSIEIAMDEEDKSQLRVLCTCPHFRRGHACKHLWAALVATDRKLHGEPKVSPSSSRNISPSKPESGSTPKTAESRPSQGANRTKTPRDWRNVLFSRNDPVGISTWDPPTPGGFRLCYELLLTNGMASLTAQQQYIRKDGYPGRSKGLQHQVLHNPDLPHEDRIILNTLRAAAPRGLISSSPQRVHLSIQEITLVIPYLAQTGRCSVFSQDSALASPLRPGTPFDLQTVFATEGKRPDKAKTLSLKPMVSLPDGNGGETRTPLEDLPLFLGDSPLFCISGEKLYRVRGLDGQQVSALKSDNFRIRVPRKDLEDLVEALETRPQAPTVELPEKLRLREESAISPLPRLRLEIKETGLQGDVTFDYNGFAVSPDEERTRLLDRENWRAINRNEQAEGQHLDELWECGFRSESRSCGCSLEEAPEAIGSLLERGWRVEAKDGKPLRSGSTPSVNVSSSGMDWFDLDGEVEFPETSVELPRAVHEFLEGNRTVRLDNGSRGLLPLDWLRRHAGELALGLETDGKRSKGSKQEASLRYHKSQALALDNLVREDTGAHLEDHFLRIRDELRRFEGLEPVEPPSEFRGDLREYQKEGLSWFEFLSRFGFGGVLADDMGLGKTVQVLAWLLQRKHNGTDAPSIVVAPASLVLNWREEARRFAPQLSLFAHIGQERASGAEELHHADLVLTTYGILLRDASMLGEIQFDHAILDESQAIKNSQSKTFQAAKALHSRHRLCLTGTPLENSLSELWSQMDFLNPGLLRSSTRFEQTLAGPAQRGDSQAGESLRRLIKPFVLRRTKEQVAPELPDKAEYTITCPMHKEQSELYSRFLAHYRESVLGVVDEQGMNRSKIKVLEALLRLRQIACHPGLVDHQGTDSGKMDKLRDLVREVRSGGRKALIFSQYTKLLGLIKKEFESQGIPYFSLDGRTPQKRRKQRVDAFQESEESCFFLISLKAGGTGLNLTAADYVFILDPWWNPAVEMQAVDRTHRIGQEKKVVSYRLISEASVEEKVLSLQEKKQEMVSSVLSGSNDMIKNLTREDLEHLFS